MEYVVTNRLDLNSTFPMGKFEDIQPVVTVADLFNNTARNDSFTYFTAKFAPEMDATNNLTKWCVTSSEFNKFFPNAQSLNSTHFEFHVNVIMNDLSTGACANSTAMSSVSFCDSINQQANCAPATFAPVLTFTDGGSSDSSGFNWKLWGSVGAGVALVVIAGVAFMV